MSAKYVFKAVLKMFGKANRVFNNRIYLHIFCHHRDFQHTGGFANA